MQIPIYISTGRGVLYGLKVGGMGVVDGNVSHLNVSFYNL